MTSFSNPPFGTIQPDPDHAGNTTLENVLNMMLPLNRMRPIVVSDNSTTTEIQADAKLALNGAVESLSLGQGAYAGVELTITNNADEEVQILDGEKIMTAKLGEILNLRWNGTEWRVKTDKLVGDFISQLPAERSPVEKHLEGTWVVWSNRAVLYGISAGAPPSYVDYYSLVGTTIAIGSTPIVCYHQEGDDFRLFQFKSSATAYIVPAELDPVKWDHILPDIIENRESCQKLATRTNGIITVTDDLQIGDVIVSGTHAGKYVTEVIVPGGKFCSVEGGFRPTFVSGGVQEGRIRNATGLAEGSGSGSIQNSGYFRTASGVFVISSSGVRYLIEGNNDLGNYKNLSIDLSRVIPTGPDVAPANVSARLWRRTA
jgi:hypothetical protein